MTTVAEIRQLASMYDFPPAENSRDLDSDFNLACKAGKYYKAYEYAAELRRRYQDNSLFKMLSEITDQPENQLRIMYKRYLATQGATYIRYW